jgi:hypothetical protein
MVERMNSPVSSFPSTGWLFNWLFLFFILNEQPQTVQLTTLDLEILQQHLVDSVRMPRCFSQPTQNRIFFDPFDTAQAADRFPSARNAKVSRIVSAEVRLP